MTETLDLTVKLGTIIILTSIAIGASISIYNISKTEITEYIQDPINDSDQIFEADDFFSVPEPLPDPATPTHFPEQIIEITTSVIPNTMIPILKGIVTAYTGIIF
jgi:hypothetical protein